MTTCTRIVTARIGQLIPSSYPCEKPADEGGLCRRHRREADAAEVRARAEREPADPERHQTYGRRLEVVGENARDLARYTGRLQIAEEGWSALRTDEADEMLKRLEQAHTQLQAARNHLSMVAMYHERAMGRIVARREREEG